MGKDFVQFVSNNSLFLRILNNSFIAWLVYVDHIIIASNNQDDVDKLKVFLNNSFKLKDLGSLRYFLSLKLESH